MRAQVNIETRERVEKWLTQSELCNKIVERYKTSEVTVAEIAREFPVPKWTLYRLLRVLIPSSELKMLQTVRYSKSKQGTKNPQFGGFGAQNPNWKGGIWADDRGYLHIKTPSGRYIPVHQQVMQAMLGLSKIPQGLIVHHIDENPANNHPDNLALTTRAGHAKIHSLYRVYRKSKKPRKEKSGTSKSTATIVTLRKV
jgi:HNH endonuclease